MKMFSAVRLIAASPKVWLGSVVGLPPVRKRGSGVVKPSLTAASDVALLRSWRSAQQGGAASTTQAPACPAVCQRWIEMVGVLVLMNS